MVRTEKALESDYLTVALVENSPTKKIVILEPGKYEDTDYGEKLRIPVQIDGKIKVWTPNKDSIKNCNRAWGSETNNWVGCIADLKIVSIQGKDSIAVFPQDLPKTTEEKVE